MKLNSKQLALLKKLKQNSEKIKKDQEEFAKEQEKRAKEKAIEEAWENSIQYHKSRYESSRRSYLLGFDITYDVYHKDITRKEYKTLTGLDYVGYKLPGSDVIIEDPLTPEREEWETKIDNEMEELRKQEEKDREEAAKNYNPNNITSDDIKNAQKIDKPAIGVITKDQIIDYAQGKNVDIKPLEDVVKEVKSEDSKVDEEVKKEEQESTQVTPKEEQPVESSPKTDAEATESVNLADKMPDIPAGTDVAKLNEINSIGDSETVRKVNSGELSVEDVDMDALRKAYMKRMEPQPQPTDVVEDNKEVSTSENTSDSNTVDEATNTNSEINGTDVTNGTSEINNANITSEVNSTDTTNGTSDSSTVNDNNNEVKDTNTTSDVGNSNAVGDTTSDTSTVAETSENNTGTTNTPSEVNNTETTSESNETTSDESGSPSETPKGEQ